MTLFHFFTFLLPLIFDPLWPNLPATFSALPEATNDTLFFLLVTLTISLGCNSAIVLQDFLMDTSFL